MQFDVRQSGTPKRPFEVWRLNEQGEGWVVFCSSSRTAAAKRAQELARDEAAPASLDKDHATYV